MSLYGLSAATRFVAAIVLVMVLSGCGAGGQDNFASAVTEPTHNKLATKVLADIAVRRVRGAMPARVASRRGRETL